MSESRWCRACGEFMFSDQHRCPPVWLVRWMDDPEGARVYAPTAKDAAGEWAKRHDEGGDYTIVGGSRETVHVRRADDESGAWQTFEVWGEAEPVYYAREVSTP